GTGCVRHATDLPDVSGLNSLNHQASGCNSRLTAGLGRPPVLRVGEDERMEGRWGMVGGLLAGALLFAAPLSISLAASPSPSTLPEPSESATPSTTPSGDWTALDWGAPLPYSESTWIADIALGGDGYLAFGAKQATDSGRAAVFTTADGA